MQHTRPQRLSTRHGFTLVELLVVISIIGILSRLLFANYGELRERGRDSSRKSAMQQMRNSLRLYYNDFQRYPADSTDGEISGCGENGIGICAWGTAFATNTTQYMSALPLDPLNVAPYQYEYQQTMAGDGFLLTVQLENETDPEATQSQSRCGVTLDQGMYAVCAQ